MNAAANRKSPNRLAKPPAPRTGDGGTCASGGWCRADGGGGEVAIGLPRLPGLWASLWVRDNPPGLLAGPRWVWLPVGEANGLAGSSWAWSAPTNASAAAAMASWPPS